MKQYVRAIVGVALAVACLYFAFRGIDYHELWGSLRQANYVWLVPAMAFVVVSMIFRTFRWRCLLSPVKRVGTMDLFCAINICFMANNFLPARSGEFIRAVLIGKKHRVSISTVLATVVLERIFDAICVMGLFLYLIFSFTVEEKWKKAGLGLVVVYSMILVLLVLGRMYSQSVQRVVHRVLSGFSSSFAQKICGLIDSFLQGLNVLKEWKQVALILMHSVCVWGTILATYYFLCGAFGVHMPLQGYVLLVCVLAVAVMAPIPGYIGSFHAAYKAALLVFGYPSSLALACAIVAHGAQYVFITILGVLCLWREGISLGRLRAEEEGAEGELGHVHPVDATG
jgi:glycosyltransferase 2 family protein